MKNRNEYGVMVIATESCNGGEQDFENWMNEHYPNIETRILNTMDGGFYDAGGDRDDTDKHWDEYCKS